MRRLQTLFFSWPLLCCLSHCVQCHHPCQMDPARFLLWSPSRLLMQTIALQNCMVEHKDYYKDFLGASHESEGAAHSCSAHVTQCRRALGHGAWGDPRKLEMLSVSGLMLLLQCKAYK